MAGWKLFSPIEAAKISEGASEYETVYQENPMTQGSIVLLGAILRGMGREESCDILARRIDDPDSSLHDRKFRFIECSVLTAPTDLPDGDYIAYFSGHSVLATRKFGLWLPSGEAVPDGNTEGPDSSRVVLPGTTASSSSRARFSSHRLSEGFPSPEDPSRSGKPRSYKH